MIELLECALGAHGGLEKWDSVRSNDALFNFSGGLLELKGFPGHLRPTVSINTSTPQSVFQGLGGDPDDRWIFTSDREWIERRDASAPFLFTRPGFKAQELEEHVENGQTWRVLEVTHPDNFPAHNKVQKIYFDRSFMLKRLDYATDVIGGVATHYCFDPKTVDGIVFPTLRRVVRRTPEGQLTSGRTSFLLDYVDV